MYNKKISKSERMTKDESGNRYGRLLVIDKAEYNSRYAYWNCLCDCGNIKAIRGSQLRNGDTTSCGCRSREILKQQQDNKRTHGLSKTNLYKRWLSMKKRCNDNNNLRYGARGIKVCKEWTNDFLSFYNWSLENGYKKELSIDRINNDGNYEPTNCRWTTAMEQRHNQMPEKEIDRRSSWIK